MTTYTQLLRELSGGQQGLSWDAWLELALAVHEDPAEWRGSYQALEAAERDELLRRFYEEAGNLGDAFVWLASRDIDAETDAANRERLQLDTLDAYSRNIERLHSLRDGLAAARAPSHLQYEVDLAAEIKGLEEQRVRLQMELENDPAYVQMTGLEAEIARLKEYRALLEGYDRAGREALLRQLQDETEALRQGKAATEDAVKEAVEARDAARAGGAAPDGGGVGAGGGAGTGAAAARRLSLWQRIAAFFKGGRR